MPMTKDQVDKLLSILEAIRAEKYPDITPKLIRDIVIAQFNNQDNRTEGNRATKALIDAFLREAVDEEGNGNAAQIS